MSCCNTHVTGGRGGRYLVCARAQTTRCTEEITWVKTFVCAVLGEGISRERGEKEGAS